MLAQPPGTSDPPTHGLVLRVGLKACILCFHYAASVIHSPGVKTDGEGWAGPKTQSVIDRPSIPDKAIQLRPMQ